MSRQLLLLADISGGGARDSKALFRVFSPLRYGAVDLADMLTRAVSLPVGSTSSSAARLSATAAVTSGM